MLGNRTAWIAAVWCALSLALGAQRDSGPVHAFEEAEVQLSAWSPWPDVVHQGYWPLMVEISNLSEGERVLTLEAEGRGWQEVELERSVALGPREKVRLELPVPAWTPIGMWGDAQVRLIASCAGERIRLGSLGPAESGADKVHPVLFLTSQSIPAGTTEAWSDQLGYETVHTGSSGGRANVELVNLHPASLPRRFDTWSSLDLVVVDTRGELPEDEVLESLFSWVRAGGAVLLFGPQSEAVLERVPGLRAWTEPRFELHRWNEAQAWMCGLGTLAVDSALGFPSLDARTAARTMLSERSTPVPRSARERSGGVPLRIPDLGEVPYRVFTFLLVCFAIVIGPVNFAIVKKMGRPVLLLLTIPAIAAVTSLGFLTYGLLHEGIDVKSASKTVTVLDQRARRASSFELRELFVGLLGGTGLRPEASTAVFPHDLSLQTDEQQLYRVSLDGGLLLAGDFLPSRQPVVQTLSSDATSRLRLELSRTSSGAVQVQNGLDADVRALILRDATGAWHQMDGELGVGESAVLVGVQLPDRRELYADLDLPASACYVAELARSPFVDDCGVSSNELSSWHRVLGIFESADLGEER